MSSSRTRENDDTGFGDFREQYIMEQYGGHDGYAKHLVESTNRMLALTDVLALGRCPLCRKTRPLRECHDLGQAICEQCITDHQPWRAGLTDTAPPETPE